MNFILHYLLLFLLPWLNSLGTPAATHNHTKHHTKHHTHTYSRLPRPVGPRGWIMVTRKNVQPTPLYVFYVWSFCVGASLPVIVRGATSVKTTRGPPSWGRPLGGSAIYEVIGWGLAGSDLCTV